MLQGIFTTADSDESRQIARDLARDLFVDLFGGGNVSAVTNEGFYLSQDSTLLEEESTFIWSFGESHEAELTALAREICEVFNQECVLIVIDGREKFISL